MNEEYGPQIPACNQVHQIKYRLSNETFTEAKAREAAAVSDDEKHRQAYKSITLDQRFLAAGRVQAAMGSPKNVTALNCFVSGSIEDSMESIMQRATEAAETMRKGGGIGFDFSLIRPRGDRIVSLDSSASGPVSFMGIFNEVCQCIMSAGTRRGAMMAVLRVDHPDVEEFIRAKKDENTLKNFNMSVGVTDEFMQAVVTDSPFNLKFGGNIYNTINARMLWDEIMRNTWEWAEPGILFLDRINEDNNLSYLETIYATNPCGEQPLPPYGACLLGSFNLVKYYIEGVFNWRLFVDDIPVIVRAMDNVIDRTEYPLEGQQREQRRKRRIGLGVTGLANILTLLGLRYGSPEAVRFTRRVMRTLCNTAYDASCDLAKEKGSFPAFNEESYLNSEFVKKLPDEIKEKIHANGIRNSHLISVAPTGTISFSADNISSGIEPVFALELDRTMQTEMGEIQVRVKDYAYDVYGVAGETVNELSVDDHLNMQIAVQPYVDSAVSKTINVGDDVTFAEFKDVYLKAWKGRLKGVTTFRAAGKRYGILNAVSSEEGSACFINPKTGGRECD